jgi:hypothetical protein
MIWATWILWKKRGAGNGEKRSVGGKRKRIKWSSRKQNRVFYIQPVLGPMRNFQ